MAVRFIDVSQHDRARRGSALDWRAIAADGEAGVMCARATYGDPNTFNPPSPYFTEHQGGARAAGFTCRGGYHNLIHGDQASINRQVDYLRRTLDSVGAVWAMADVEKYPELVANGLWPRWDDLRRFNDRWYAVDDRVLAWYVAQWVWSGQLKSPDLRHLQGPLFNAHYGGGDGTAAHIYTTAGGDHAPGWGAYGNRTPDVLQFTSVANVPGATASTDVNAYRGTLADLQTLLTKGHPPMTDPSGAKQLQDVAWSVGRGAPKEGAPEGNEAMTFWAGRVSVHLAELAAELAALRAIIEALAKAVNAGGGSVDTAAVLAGVDTRLLALRADIATDTRTTQAASDEGSAAAMRAATS